MIGYTIIEIDKRIIYQCKHASHIPSTIPIELESTFLVYFQINTKPDNIFKSYQRLMNLCLGVEFHCVNTPLSSFLKL